MMLQPWELRVWTPLGDGPRIIPRDESYIRATGLRMQLTPEGDCREAAFTARGNGLGVRTLDCVQIVYGGTPLFYGEVRDGGNVRDVDGHGYVLRSLTARLGEVSLSEAFTTPQQPAHLTVQALLQDVLPSLSGTVLYDPALCPDLGFDLAPVKASNFQNPKALLEKIAEAGKGFGVTVVYGVGADRRFFCRAASTNSRPLSHEELTGAVQWREPVAEVVCTAVRWLLARQTETPGRWLSHVSRSPETALYGERVKTVPWAEGAEGQAELWAPERLSYVVDPDSTMYASSGEYDANGYGLYSETDPQFGEPRLTDGEANSFSGLMVSRRHTYTHSGGTETGVTYNSKTSDLVVYGQASQMFERVHIGVWAYWVRRVYTSSTSTYYTEETKPVTATISLGNLSLTRQLPTDSGAPMLSILSPGDRVTIRVPMPNRPGKEWELYVTFSELAAERFSRTTLDRLAGYHYKTPATEPADIELRTFIPPADLPKYVTLDDYQSIVDAWEYRLSAERGMTLGCLAGQAEDPAALAQADLIKARDGQAVITAITAGGAG